MLADVQAGDFSRRTIGFDPTRKRNGATFPSPAVIITISVLTSGKARAPAAATTGLARFSLEIERQDLFAAQEARLRQAGVLVAPVANVAKAVDPWGTRVRPIRI